MPEEQQSTWKRWGISGVKTAMQISDWAGVRANAVGARFGAERFWPTSNDYQEELEKCERILRTFCVEGLPTEESTDGGKKKRKVYRKIPPKVIQEAQGLVIFSAFRSGIAPFAGAGGGGIVISRMSNGLWSPPSFVSPNNLSVGAMIGFDAYNCILVLRTKEAVLGFRTHHLTLGSEIAVAAGPVGYGASAEAGFKNRAPIFSYVLSRGFYAGVEMVGQVFVDRFDENERVYYWPGIKAGDIFDGKVRRPPKSEKFYISLEDAESGVAQGANLEWDTEEITQLDLSEGETLRLPPTPSQLEMWEANGMQDEEDLRLEKEEREAIRALPPPPKHPHSRVANQRRLEAKNRWNGAQSGTNSPDVGSSGFNSPVMGPPLGSDGGSRDVFKQESVIEVPPVDTAAKEEKLEIPPPAVIEVVHQAEEILIPSPPAPTRFDSEASFTSRTSIYSEAEEGKDGEEPKTDAVPTYDVASLEAATVGLGIDKTPEQRPA